MNENRFTYEDLLIKFMEEDLGFDDSFYNIPDNVERVQFFQNTEESNMHYRQAIRFQNDPNKSATEANLYRIEGNQCFGNKKYIAALEFINKSICFAPEHSEQLAKGYANRSAVYLSLNMFELALKNIEKARETGYPEHLLPKLNEREAKCMEMLKKLEEKPKNTFNGLKPELSYPPHEKVPFIANCLELQENEKYGRHIVTKDDLKVGDVVAIESPYCAAISPGAQYMFCAHCFRENDLNLLPCPNCHSAMFCDQECLAAANEGFHAIECPIMDILVRSGKFDYEARTAFRLFIVVMKNFESAEQLIQFTKDLEFREQNVFNVNYEQTKNIDLLKLMVPQPDSRDSIIAVNTLNTALMTEILLKLTSFEEIFKSNKEIQFLIGFIFRLSDILQLHNCAGSKKQISKPQSNGELNFRGASSCYGIYPFGSLLNHSCASNTRSVKHGTQSVLIVVKPIKRGEQLFTSYGLHHNIEDRELRQKRLHQNFMFTCDCLACVRNYPPLTVMDMLIQNDSFIDPMHHASLCKDYKIDDVKKLIPKYCQYLNEHSAEYPKNNTNAAEEVLMKCFTLLYTDEVPLADKQRLQLN